MDATPRLQNSLTLAEMQKRLHPRPQDVRGAFYRDTTAIIHSSPFRRLKHKTQVFFAPSNDHICTRMEHVLHVASIASTICRGLQLDSELAWAIGMGHDLGHTPFGHVGEEILSELMNEQGLSGFEHESNSLRIVDFLAERGKGLNLTYAVRDGIAKHNGEVFVQSVGIATTVEELSIGHSYRKSLPATWEAAVVRFADQIAYLGRDFEDACRLGIIEETSLPQLVVQRLGRRNSEIINCLVTDIMTHSNGEAGITFSDEIFEAVVMMRNFNYEHIYKAPLLAGYTRYFTRLLRLIVNYLQEMLDTYDLDGERYREERNMLAAGFFHYLEEMHHHYLAIDGNLNRLVFDYVAGMSDNFALDCAREILIPEHLNEHISQSLTGKWFDVR